MRTQEFHKVNLLTLSPNFWDENSFGNKHYFLIINECKNPDSVRGFYNEYLSSEFQPHSKSFELLGAKMAVPYSENQMSGIGLSSSKESTITVKTTGVGSQIFNVKF